jgi:uncharacterized protein YcfJ
MKLSIRVTSLALLTTLAASAFAPLALADSSSTQKDKNNMRSLGIAGAAVAGYGLLKGNSTATLLGAAAGGYGAYKYEQDRKAQDEQKRARQHTRYHRSYTENGRKYYRYNGNLYYLDQATGQRHLANP